jgi:surface antigen
MPGSQSVQHSSADASLLSPESGVSTPRTERPAAEVRQSTPRIVKASARLQCVPYARDLSTIQIRGDAWTWWASAKGRYERGQEPRLGAVLVLKRKGNSRGHLAVVTRIVNEREIIVNHANWLNRGRVHLDTPIRDVSPNNNWSAVRVWYTPGNVLGKSTYPAYGFIYPPLRTASR